MTKGTPVFRPAPPPVRAAKRTLLALLAAAAVAGWIALFEREESPSDDGQPVFSLTEEDILAVEIERPGELSVRVGREGEGFVITEGDGPETAGDASEVELLLQNVASLRYEREIENVAEEDLAGFGLATPELGIRVRTGALGADPLSAGFGDETPAAGTDTSVSAPRVFVISAFARDNFDRDAWDLRDKRVFRLDTPAARGLRLETGEGKTAELAREEGIWRIVRPYRLAADPYEASQFATRLLDASMAGLAPDPVDDEEDGFGLHAPRLSAALDLVVGPQEEPVSRTIRFGGESRTLPGVFASIEPDPLVFVVNQSLFDALREAVDTEMASLRSLRLFRFAGFRAVALRVTSPDGEVFFERREGEEGREWTMEAGGAAPALVDTVAVEDLLYKLNSTDAEDIGGQLLPDHEADGGADWTFAVTEESDGAQPESQPETVRLKVTDSGEVRALRTGDERTLLIPQGAWTEITALLASARTPL